MIDETVGAEGKVAVRFAALGPELNERQRRLWAGAEALAYGHGGIAAVARVAGISRDTVERGIRDVRSGERLAAGQVRRAGAGRPRLTDSDPDLLGELQALVDPETRGDPMSALRWTTKSLMKLAGVLSGSGHQVSDRTVGKLLRGLGCGVSEFVIERSAFSTQRQGLWRGRFVARDWVASVPISPAVHGRRNPSKAPLFPSRRWAWSVLGMLVIACWLDCA